MSKSGLGKAIQNRLEKKQRIAVGDKAPIFYQETEQNQAEIKKQKMRSVIQQNSLNQFLQTAQLSQQNFKANRDIKFRQIRQQIRNKKVIMINNKAVLIQDDIDQSKLKTLQMPRRPKWKQLNNKQQLAKSQAQAYLTWRRNLAQLQQSSNDIKITPYEKNIQVWKQLWRVTQRSDLIVQIVDGRDPLFFRSEDLVDYVNQIDPKKKSLLLVNKSDLVPEEVRLRWNHYFIQHNINHIFFSAKLADEQISQNQGQVSDTLSQKTVQSEIKSQNQIIQHHFNKPQIISIKQLIALFNEYAKLFQKQKIEVGLVGYPNVGKSSVINALLGQKKVGVASMPGKTKHFQTLKLSDQVTLCDCPGLVFPRISASHAYMVLNGLYPIDTIKSYSEPIKILVDRIPKKVMEQAYAIHWKQNQVYDSDALLNKYSTLKGFITGNGLPNQSVAAKNILKDYVNGVIIYARNPPGLKSQDPQKKQQPVQQAQQLGDKTAQKQQQAEPDMKKKQHNIQNALDSQFFKQQKSKTLAEQNFIKQLTQDDLLDIVQGKKIAGFKVTKEMRANIKHGMKRGQNLETIKKKYFGVKGAGTANDPKKFISS